MLFSRSRQQLKTPGSCDPAEPMGLEVSVIDKGSVGVGSLASSVRRVTAQTVKVLE